MPASAPEARRPRRPLPARALAAAPVALLGVVVLIFYLVEASLEKAPWVFTDELEWTQLSRAIAATGHAARRGQPVFFKSLYAYLIAPAWWIHSTAAAYAAIKDIDSLVMCLTAVPVYLLARMLCRRPVALAVALLAIAIPAMSYATLVIPEPLAYLWFGLFAWLAVRALAAPRAATVAPALLVAALGPLIEKEFVVLPAVGLLAAAALWALRGAAGVRPRPRRVLLALVGLGVFAYAFNALVVEHVQQWTFSSYVNGGTLGAGGLALGALAIGLGMLPLIGGLASLWLPERRDDPVYRAFAALLAAAVVTLCVYTAAKVTHLASTQPLAEERNLFYLSPLLLLGTALALAARRLDWRLVAAASALALAVVWSADSSELGAPQYGAPGLAILSLVNRDFRWDAHDFRLLLVAVTAVSLALLALRARRGVPLLAALLLGAWLLTGEIYETANNETAANASALTVPAPRDWVDLAAHGASVTYLGESVSDTVTLWLTEFWNRSLAHVGSITGGAPGPGPALAPVLTSIDGALSEYTGDPYTLADLGVTLQAHAVAHRKNYTLYATPRPWRLLQAEQGVDEDGWMSQYANYTYFARGGPGVLTIDLSRTAYTGPGTPASVQITVGTAGLDAKGEPAIAHRVVLLTRTVPDGRRVVVRVPVPRTPVTLTLWVASKTLLSVPGDARLLGVQPAFAFSRSGASLTRDGRRRPAAVSSPR